MSSCSPIDEVVNTRKEYKRSVRVTLRCKRIGLDCSTTLPVQRHEEVQHDAIVNAILDMMTASTTPIVRDAVKVLCCTMTSDGWSIIDCAKMNDLSSRLRDAVETVTLFEWRVQQGRNWVSGPFANWLATESREENGKVIETNVCVQLSQVVFTPSGLRRLRQSLPVAFSDQECAACMGHIGSLEEWLEL